MLTTPPQSPTEVNADFQKLLQAFDVFNQASESLQQSYRELQVEAQRLSAELALTNAELERSLSEKESFKNYLKNILESLSNGVLVVDREKRPTICNPAALALLGLFPDEVRSAQTYRELALPELLKEFIEAALDRGSEAMEDLELQCNCPLGGERFLAVSASPVTGQGDQREGLTIVVKDITRLKELELQTQRAKQLQAMGEMAVQLAHEIRNPLGSIELFASLLGKELRSQPDFRGWADQIVTGVKFLNNIVTNMLTFTRSSRPQLQPFELRQLITETLAFVEPVLLQRNVCLENIAEQESSSCLGDASMLRQMFLNLFMNALQAMPEGGRLTVRLENGEAQTLRVIVEDTGIGIPSANLERIFDPFFTTHEKGTGLGLALVHQIVEKHQGQIFAESAFGRGTRFTISLPSGQGTASREQGTSLASTVPF